MRLTFATFASFALSAFVFADDLPTAKLVFKGDGYLIHFLPKNGGTLVHTATASGEMKILAAGGDLLRMPAPVVARATQIDAVAADKDRIFVLERRSSPGNYAAVYSSWRLLAFRSRDGKAIYSSKTDLMPTWPKDADVAGPLKIHGDGVTCDGTRFEFRGDEFVREISEIKSSKVEVDKSKLTFDPKTCTKGEGILYWGLGSSAVKILGHEDGQCQFEYTAEVEMGYTVYHVRVPLDSGLVKIEVGTIKEGATSWTGIITSFPLDKAKVIRRGGGPDAGK